MKRIFIAVALVSVMATVTSTAHASKNARDLTVQYARYVLAFRGRDVGPIQAQMVPGWAGVKDGQTISRATMLANTQRMMDSLKAVKDMCVKLGKITDRGSTVNVVIHETSDLIMVDRNGRERHVLIDGHSTDTWRRTASGLKLAKSVVMDEKVKVDGQVLPANSPLPI